MVVTDSAAVVSVCSPFVVIGLPVLNVVTWSAAVVSSTSVVMTVVPSVTPVVLSTAAVVTIVAFSVVPALAVLVANPVLPVCDVASTNLVTETLVFSIGLVASASVVVPAVSWPEVVLIDSAVLVTVCSVPVASVASVFDDVPSSAVVAACESVVTSMVVAATGVEDEVASDVTIVLCAVETMSDGSVVTSGLSVRDAVTSDSVDEMVLASTDDRSASSVVLLIVGSTDAVLLEPTVVVAACSVWVESVALVLDNGVVAALDLVFTSVVSVSRGVLSTASVVTSVGRELEPASVATVVKKVPPERVVVLTESVWVSSDPMVVSAVRTSDVVRADSAVLVAA